jgi:hypothetical protein
MFALLHAKDNLCSGLEKSKPGSAEKRIPYSLIIGFMLLVGMNSTSTFAKDYKVEAIVFKQLNAGAAAESHRYTPPSSPHSASATWAIDASMLVDDVVSLNESPDYEIVQTFSWAQESLPFSESASMSMYEPSLKGWIKVYANSLLYVNLDLEMEGFRLTEKRRIKLDEKHFFDHPKFAVLMQVSRLEKPAEETVETP